MQRRMLHGNSDKLNIIAVKTLILFYLNARHLSTFVFLYYINVGYSSTFQTAAVQTVNSSSKTQ